MRNVILGLLCLLAAVSIQAQTPPAPQVTLTWVAPTTGPAATGYNVYRYATACPAQISLTTATKLTSAPQTALTYSDTAVVRGTTYCYFVTATTASAESAASGAAQVAVPLYLAQAAPNPPAAPGVTAQ